MMRVRLLTRRLLPATLFISVLVLAGLSRGQHMLFHLLGASEPIANFTSTSQTVAEADGAWSAWPSGLNAWTRRRQILVDGVSGALTGFPVMIKIDSTRIDYAQTQDSGQDLRFADSSGNLLSYEIERWDESGTSVAWVKVPTLAGYPSQASIWMYYGNAVASDAQSASTWDASFIKVLHLNGSIGSINNGASVTASVGSAATANNGGSGMSFASAQVGTGVVLDGTDDWINVGADASLSFGASAPFTVSLHIKTSDTTGPVVNFRDLTTGNPILGLYIGYNGATTQSGKINVLLRDNAGGAGYVQLVGPSIGDSQWHHVVLSRNAGSNVSLYVDGVSYGTASSSGSGGAITTDQRAIGSDRNWVAGGYSSVDGRFFAGTVDDLQISSAQRSADWIQASYLSARDELTSFSAEQTQATGATTITVGLNSPAETTVTIPYTVTGTATAGTDHSRVSGTLVINGGSSSGSLNTYVLRDNLVEGAETAILTLGAPTGATLGPDSVHTVTITDEALSPPDAIDDSVNVTSLGAVTIPVLSNDTDPNGDTLTITSFTAASSGTVTRVAQQLVYTPSGDFGATDSFTYTISDGRGGSDTATVTLNYQIPFTWIGSGADANWTTTANWLGGAVPGVGNTVYFNNQCTTYCSPTVVGNVSVAGLRLNTSYGAGAINMLTYSLTLGTSGFTQRSGTFNCGSNSMTSTGAITIAGGSFVATSGTTSSQSSLAIANASDFSHSSGLWLQKATGTNSWTLPTTGDVDFYDLQFDASGTDFNIAMTSGSTWNVLRTLTVGSSTAEYSGFVNGGTMNVYGDINLLGAGGRGTTLVKIVGTGTQTITGSGTGHLPSLEVAKPSGTLNLVNTIRVDRNFTYTSGTVDPGTSTMQFRGQDGSTRTHNFNGLSLNSVIFSNLNIATDLGGSTLTVLGSLTMQNAGYTLSNGTIYVKGSVACASSTPGTVNVIMDGASAAGTSATGVYACRGLEIAKTGGAAVTQSSNFYLNASGQDMTVTSGTYSLAGFSLTVGDVLTVASGAKLLCGGGTLTYGSAIINGEVSCGPALGITWTGLAGDGLWTTAGNWTNNTIPGASDIAYFNGACTNCNVTMNTNVSVKGIVAASTYTGTMSQGAANTITVGTSGWTHAGGTFTGASSAITLSGVFALSGGTFTSTSGTMTTRSTYTVSGSPTYNHSSGTLALSAADGATVNVTPGSVEYNNVTFGGVAVNFNVSGTMSVNGMLLLADTYASHTQLMSGGTVAAKGNVSVTGYGKGGTTLIKVAGSADQTFTGVSTGMIPSVEIASTGGTVTFVGTLALHGNYTYTSGVVDAGSSTLYFSSYGTAARSLVPGTVNYNNVTLGGLQLTLTVTGTMTVNGTLTISDAYSVPGGINTGTVLANGDVVINNYGKEGTGLVKIAGSGNQLITGSASARLKRLEIASTGGVVSLAGTIILHGNYTYTSGTIDATTSTLIFTSGGSQTVSVIPGPVDYYNVTFTGFDGTQTITGTMSVTGTLNVGDTYSSYTGAINTGTILAKGPVTYTSYGKTGTATVKIAGNADQTVTGVSSAKSPKFEVASTGGVVTLSGTLWMNQTYTHTSGTVDAGTSVVTFTPNNYSTGTYIPGPTVFNDVKFDGRQSTANLTGTLSVNGQLTLNDTEGTAGSINGGTISAKGNLSATGSGKVGSVRLQIAGSSSQTLTGTTTANIPNLEIYSTGGTVTYSGTLKLSGDYIYNSGTISVGTSILLFAAPSWQSRALTPGTTGYGDVTFSGYATNYTLTGTLTVNGTLTFADTYSLSGGINTGTITANGNVVSSGGGKRGNSLLTIAGGSAATLSAPQYAYLPGSVVTVDKSGATLTLTQAVWVTNGTQDLTITAGTLDMAGYNLTVGRHVTNSGTLNRGTNPSCGTLSYGGTYSGNATVCP